MNNNVYTTVVDGVVQEKVRVRHGQSFGNVSYGLDATEQTYKDNGMYLVISKKPSITEAQVREHTGFTIDDKEKIVTINWSVQDKSAEEVADVVERGLKEIEVKEGTLSGVTMAQAENYISANVSDPGTAKVLKKLTRYVLARI